MVTERPLEQLTSDELFRAATEAQEPETPQEPTEQAPPEAPAQEPIPPPPPAPPPQQQEPGVPSWRLREEADRARAAEQRAQQLEARLAEVAAHIKQNQKQPDFFENPDAATKALIVQTLQPFVENLAQNQEQDRMERMYNSRMVAEVVHGTDKVAQAERSFLEARERQTLDPNDYERVVSSRNRFDEVVKWHKRQAVLSSVGDDPAAWFEKQLDAQMNDPKFQAALLERVRGAAATKPAETRLPPSLSRTTASTGNREDIGDMSDQSLWAHANKR